MAGRLTVAIAENKGFGFSKLLPDRLPVPLVPCDFSPPRGRAGALPSASRLGLCCGNGCPRPHRAPKSVSTGTAWLQFALPPSLLPSASVTTDFCGSRWGQNTCRFALVSRHCCGTAAGSISGWLTRLSVIGVTMTTLFCHYTPDPETKQGRDDQAAAAEQDNVTRIAAKEAFVKER